MFYFLEKYLQNQLNKKWNKKWNECGFDMKMKMFIIQKWKLWNYIFLKEKNNLIFDLYKFKDIILSYSEIFFKDLILILVFEFSFIYGVCNYNWWELIDGYLILFNDKFLYFFRYVLIVVNFSLNFFIIQIIFNNKLSLLSFVMSK